MIQFSRMTQQRHACTVLDVLLEQGTLTVEKELTAVLDCGETDISLVVIIETSGGPRPGQVTISTPGYKRGGKGDDHDVRRCRVCGCTDVPRSVQPEGGRRSPATSDRTNEKPSSSSKAWRAGATASAGCARARRSSMPSFSRKSPATRGKRRSTCTIRRCWSSGSRLRRRSHWGRQRSGFTRRPHHRRR